MKIINNSVLLLPFFNSIVLIDFIVFFDFAHVAVQSQVVTIQAQQLLTFDRFIKYQLKLILLDQTIIDEHLLVGGPLFWRREEGIDTDSKFIKMYLNVC
jgi:hypothetical protein